MLSWKEIVQNYIIKHANSIKRATKPLRDHFGIGYFTYHRVDLTGTYTVLVDRPDWAEHYVSQKIFLNDPYLRHPSVYQSGISLIDSHGSKDYLETILEAGKQVLDMEIGVVLIQKKADFVEFFGFAANSETSTLKNIYLNHPQLLNSFATYFKKEMQPLLHHMEQNASSLIDLKGDDFFCKQPIFPAILPSTRLSFQQDLGVKCDLEKSKKLTPREKQCLKLLIASKSAKETGTQLGLSRRTIESYFENIKDKLSCWSKQELLEIAKNFEEMGLL